MEKEYRGYKLSYNEYVNSWFSEAKDSGDNISLAQAKEFVDKMVKREFKPIDVYYGHDLTPAKITSITDGGDIWISYEGRYKNRTKINEYNRKDLIEISAENVEKGLKRKEKQKEMEKLREEIKQIEESFKVFDIQKLINQV